MELYEHQLQAIKKLKNGSILCGGVGTGKSRTALAYYYILECQGQMCINGKGSWGAMKAPRDLYVITTAKKRDTKEWETEMLPFLLNQQNVKVVVDSWNNIRKYEKEYGAFFIFDEQRVVGYGSWVKSFLRISRKNRWILLSATPGDTWSDYIPVFVANGFYKNKTEFVIKHVVYNRFVKYPKIDRYINTGELFKHRSEVLVNMQYERKTKQHHNYILVDYDAERYSRIVKDRWDIYDNEPIKETGKLCYLMRKVVNSDGSRLDAVKDLVFLHRKVIVFYNYDYELDLLRQLASFMEWPYAEWNGQKHEPVPTGESWMYLVQYAAGAEGWNCITTDTIIFFSQSYSYRMTVQAAGRIDRLNTTYTDLYYYHLRSRASIDLAISRALHNKQNFNERSFISA
jgi:hypothetical protein